MKSLLLLLTVLFLTLVAGNSWAQKDELTSPIDEKWDHKKECSIDTPSGVLAVKMHGYNICIASYLAKEKGAVSQLKKYGCQPVFRVKKALCLNGDPLPDMDNWYIHYLKTDKSRPLFEKKARNRPVIVKGKFYIPQRVLEVTSLKLLRRRKRTKKPPKAAKTEKKPTTTVSAPSVPWYEERLKEARRKLGLPESKTETKTTTPVAAKKVKKPKKKAPKPKKPKKPTKPTVKPWYQERLEAAKKKLEQSKQK